MSFAVAVIDMLNPYEHEDADPLIESARRAVPAIRRLVDAARARDAFVVYVNDNYTDWTAHREGIVEKARAGRAPELIEPIAPGPEIPFVVKARHSIFYGTQVEYMLRNEGVERLILTGQVTEQCVLYSALDAYVRHFEITLARDCLAHIDERLADAALRMMEGNMRAHVFDTAEEAIEAAAQAAQGTSAGPGAHTAQRA